MTDNQHRVLLKALNEIEKDYHRAVTFEFVHLNVLNEHEIMVIAKVDLQQLEFWDEEGR